MQIGHARQEMSQWESEQQAELLAQYQDFLGRFDDSLRREHREGHFTASAILIDPNAEMVMLVDHPKVKRWLQMGGHIEQGDASFHGAALRELREESGYRDISVITTPLRLDRHTVPCAGGMSVHWDVQFLALTDGEGPRKVTESAPATWFDLDRVLEEIPDLDSSVQSLLRAAQLFLYPQVS